MYVLQSVSLWLKHALTPIIAQTTSVEAKVAAENADCDYFQLIAEYVHRQLMPSSFIKAAWSHGV